jgi:protein O-GlcNAc transferase
MSELPPARLTDAPRSPGCLRLCLLGVVILALPVLGWYAWLWFTAPAPPEVSLADVDPAVAAAIESARQEARSKPRSVAAWGRLGQLLRAHGYVPESNVCFARAERLAPDDPRWPYLQGIGLRSDDPEAAIGHLERAVGLCGNTPDAPRLELAEVCLQQRRFDEAEQHFRQALDGDAGNARAHLGLGRLSLERGKAGDAVSHLERSAASPLTQKASRVLLAQAHQQLGDTAAAGRERARALELPGDPPWPDPFQEEVQSLKISRQARLAHLQTLQRQGREAEAQALARELKSDYPDVYWLVEARGQMTRGDFDGAERSLREAVALAPDLVEAHFDLGTVLFVKRNYAAAADSFHKVTDLEPGYGPAYLQLGRCLVNQGDRTGAIRAFESAVRYMPHQAEARRELGAILMQEGRHDEAGVLLKQALQLNPEDTKARGLLDELGRRKP